MLLTRSSVKRLISVLGETISLEVQKLLSSMTERKPYVNFGGLFSQILGSFFTETTYFSQYLVHSLQNIPPFYIVISQ